MGEHLLDFGQRHLGRRLAEAHETNRTVGIIIPVEPVLDVCPQCPLERGKAACELVENCAVNHLVDLLPMEVHMLVARIQQVAEVIRCLPGETHAIDTVAQVIRIPSRFAKHGRQRVVRRVLVAVVVEFLESCVTIGKRIRAGKILECLRQDTVANQLVCPHNAHVAENLPHQIRNLGRSQS